MSYIVFARKWRPQKFEEVVGQGHITETLKNAIKNNRVAHAYLFAGPRGIGKTTMARLLAKALDCQKGPAVEPCGSCTACAEIAGGRSLDVIEIDGASNRGIDEIRNLRDNIKLSPASGKYKIYIIDEVHQITPDAFNALLKTLEEPPAHVKFIFATTHPHKVPATILSRCQRFDFKRIAADDIINKLKRIAKSEAINIAEDALFTITLQAEGSLRDAESLLDQLHSSGKKKIELDDVIELLGMVHHDVLFKMAQAILEKQTGPALETIQKIIDDGKDLSVFVPALAEHFRNLVVSKLAKDSLTLIPLQQELKNKIAAQAAAYTAEELMYIFQVLLASQEKLRYSPSPRIVFEVAVTKLCMRGNIMNLDEIMKRISALEGGAASDEPAAARAPLTAPLAPAPDPPAQPPPPIAGELTLSAVEQRWSDVIKAARDKKISVASYLLEGYPIGLDGAALTIGFPRQFSFHKEALEHADNRHIIEEALKNALGSGINVKFVSVDSLSNVTRKDLNGDDVASGSGSEEIEARQEADKTAFTDPIVHQALDMFKGKIKRG